MFRALSPVDALCHHNSVYTPKTRYNGRAYGMDIRVEKEDDGTLSVYEAPPFSDVFRFVKRGPAAEIISHYDVSGSMQTFFGRYWHNFTVTAGGTAMSDPQERPTDDFEIADPVEPGDLPFEKREEEATDDPGEDEASEGSLNDREGGEEPFTSAS